MKTKRRINSRWVWSRRERAQQRLRVVEEEVELGRTKFRHKKERVMPRDKATLKTDEARFRAVNKDVGGCETVMAMWAGGVVPCARSKSIGVVGMKGMSCDQLEACRLKIT